MARRIVLFIALYVAVGIIFSVRVPVLVSGVSYENGGARAYSNATSDYAYTLIRNRMHPSGAKATTQGDIFDRVAGQPCSPQQAPAPKQSASAGDGPWNDYTPVESDTKLGFRPAYSVTTAIGLDTARYIVRLVIILIVLGTLWFGIIPYYGEIKQLVWFLPLFIYVAVAILRLLYVPCVWTDHFRYRDIDHSATIALWSVGSESIRYGLLIFDEFVLLVLVAACYGLALAIVKRTLPNMRIFSSTRSD